jgi:hypothetical protein
MGGGSSPQNQRQSEASRNQSRETPSRPDDAFSRRDPLGNGFWRPEALCAIAAQREIWYSCGRRFRLVFCGTCRNSPIVRARALTFSVGGREPYVGTWFFLAHFSSFCRPKAALAKSPSPDNMASFGYEGHGCLSTAREGFLLHIFTLNKSYVSRSHKCRF